MVDSLNLSTKGKWFSGMHLHNYLRYLLFYRNHKTPISTDTEGRFLFGREYNEWVTDYTPKWSLEGKRVLDVGASCGETAYLFFKEGAASVDCIEKDERKALYLKANANINEWDSFICVRPFAISDLLIHYDWVKIDIEGAEKDLLPLHSLPPCVIEIHSIELMRAFRDKFPQMEIVHKYHWPFDTWLGKLDG